MTIYWINVKRVYAITFMWMLILTFHFGDGVFVYAGPLEEGEEEVESFTLTPIIKRKPPVRKKWTGDRDYPILPLFLVRREIQNELQVISRLSEPELDHRLDKATSDLTLRALLVLAEQNDVCAELSLKRYIRRLFPFEVGVFERIAFSPEQISFLESGESSYKNLSLGGAKAKEYLLRAKLFLFTSLEVALYLSERPSLLPSWDVLVKKLEWDEIEEVVEHLEYLNKRKKDRSKES